MVRREWWIAMAIIFVALMALVFTFCYSTGDTNTTGMAIPLSAFQVP